VWVEARAVDDPWLGGDLAGHVAAYGVWLHGERPFRMAEVRFDVAASRKEARIVRLLGGLARVWSLLGPAYRRRHATLLRRDTQRLIELRRSTPVPPTAYLDAAWHERSALPLRETLLLLGAASPLAEAIDEHARCDAARSRLLVDQRAPSMDRPVPSVDQRQPSVDRREPRVE
jgi:hypothetical protein